MYTMDEFIAHHGILGQRWGIRRYQNKDGSLTAAGRRHWDQLDKKTKAKIKDNMIRSSNIKVLQAHQKYLTPNEIRKATERLAVNKTISDFKEEEIQRGMQRIADLGNKAKQVGDTVTNLSNAYNSIAKVINSVSDKNLPIIGEKKEIKPRDFSLKDLSKTDLTKLKGEELKNAMNTMLNYNKMDKNIREYNGRITNDNNQRKKMEREKADAIRRADEKAREENAEMVFNKRNENYNKRVEKYQQQKAYEKAKGEKTEINPKKENKASENKSTFLLTGPTTKDNNLLSLPDKSSDVKALPDKSSNTILALPGPVKTETTKSYSAFKEHYTSDDIASARNYVLSNFGNVSYNSIGDYKYSNSSFSAQYNKMTERNNNRNPYFSHADMSYDALIASFAN